MSALPLAIDDLRVAYELSGERRVDVLQEVSLTIGPGEVVGLIGEGGSGKSTLVEAIVGLLPSSASVSGSVDIFGRDVRGLPFREQQAIRGVEVGTIVSGGRARLNPMARIGDQIANVLRDHGMAKAARRERTLELLRDVGISDPERRMRAYPHELSGGMAQRVVIAIAIACGPRLLLADEPTRGLDVTIAADILELLGALITDRGASAMIATRDLGIVAQHCDRIVVLRDGRIVDDLPVAEFFPEPPSAYGRELLAAEYDALNASTRRDGAPVGTKVQAR